MKKALHICDFLIWTFFTIVVLFCLSSLYPTILLDVKAMKTEIFKYVFYYKLLCSKSLEQYYFFFQCCMQS